MISPTCSKKNQNENQKKVTDKEIAANEPIEYVPSDESPSKFAHDEKLLKHTNETTIMTNAVTTLLMSEYVAEKHIFVQANVNHHYINRERILEEKQKGMTKSERHDTFLTLLGNNPRGKCCDIKISDPPPRRRKDFLL